MLILLIVPLRNWNVVAEYDNDVSVTLLIVPLRNWNEIGEDCPNAVDAFNCTTEELKSWNVYCLQTLQNF